MLLLGNESLIVSMLWLFAQAWDGRRANGVLIRRFLAEVTYSRVQCTLAPALPLEVQFNLNMFPKIERFSPGKYFYTSHSICTKIIFNVSLLLLLIATLSTSR